MRTTHRNARVNSGLERWLHVSTITYGALVGVNTGRTRGHPPIDPRSERTLHSRGAGPLIRCFFLTQWPDEHRCSGPAPLSAANNSRPSNSSISFRNRSCNSPSDVSIERPAALVGVQGIYARAFLSYALLIPLLVFRLPLASVGLGLNTLCGFNA